MNNRARSFIDVSIGRLRLRAGGVSTLGTVLLLALLIGLGLWQLDRAAQKEQLQAEYDERQAGPPKQLFSILESDAVLRFRPVRVRGRYEPEFQILLDNRVQEGRVGYHVLTPLRIEEGHVRVLVNRGWVFLGKDRSQLPRVDTPEGVVELTGTAILPVRGGFRLGPPAPATDGWQTLWQYLDLDEYARRVPFAVQPAVILLDPHHPSDGFVRKWGRPDSGVATHRGYALQWFSLAVALLAIYILVNVRRDPHEPNRNTS